MRNENDVFEKDLAKAEKYLAFASEPRYSDCVISFSALYLVTDDLII